MPKPAVYRRIIHFTMLF